MKKIIAITITAIFAFGIFSAFDVTTSAQAQDKKPAQMKEKKDKDKPKAFSKEDMKKKRMEMMKERGMSDEEIKKHFEDEEKRKKERATANANRFNFANPNIVKQLHKEDLQTLDLNFDNTILLKHMFAQKDKDGKTYLHIVIENKAEVKNMYDMKVKLTNSGGKAVHTISIPLGRYGMDLRKDMMSYAKIDITTWAGKYDHFDVSIEVPVKPVLQVDGKNSVTIK